MNRLFIYNIVFILFFLSLPFVLGVEQHLGTFYQYDQVKLVQSCNNCTYIKLNSIVTPQNVYNYTKNFTKLGNFYNYTWVSPDYPMQIGEYLVYGEGDLDGNVQVFVYDFSVVMDNRGVLNVENDMLSILAVILLFVFCVVLLFFGVFTFAGLGFMIIGSIFIFSAGNFAIGMFFVGLGLIILMKGRGGW